MTFIPRVGASAGVGSSLPQQQPRDTFGGEVGREWGRRTQVIAYSEGSSSWRGSVPNEGTAHPAADWLKLRRYAFTQDPSAPGQGRLTLDYEQDEFSASYPTPGLPDDEVVEDGGTLEIDIRRHPAFDDFLFELDGDLPVTASMRAFYDWRNERIYAEATIPEEAEDSQGKTVTPEFAGQAVPEALRGVSSYLVGTGTVTVTSYSYTEPASVLEQGGKRAKPAGYGGTLNNWLVLSAVKQELGAYWTRRVVYQYSAKAISPDVYGEASL